MKLLSLHIREPLAGAVYSEMPVSGDEAARRYKSVVVTTLRQLKGLVDTRIRLHVSPEDGAEAVRFWLLPRLADRWQEENRVLRSDGWEIDFGDNEEAFEIRATGEVLCPHLGARWVHASLLGIGRTVSRVIGPAENGGYYFTAESDGDLGERLLPELPVILTEDDWQAALTGPLGASLNKAWEAEGH